MMQTMIRRDKWFPVLFTLPFLFGTTLLPVIFVAASYGRWIVLGLAGVLALNYGLRRGIGQQIKLVAADRIAIVFLLFFAMTSAWSIAPSITSLRALSLVLLYAAAFWYAWGYADSYSDASLIRLILGTITVVVGLNLLASAATNPGSLVSQRFQGYFANPNNLGLIGSVSIPLAFAMLLKNKTGKWQWITLGVLVLSVVASGSRTGILSATAGVVIIAVLKAQSANQIASFIATAVLVISAAYVLVPSSVAENAADSQIIRTDTLLTMSNRTIFWELATTEYIPSRPWQGHGFGTDEHVHAYHGRSLIKSKLRGYGVMSSYYGLAMTIGIPAAILFYIALGSPVFIGLMWYRHNENVIVLSAAVVSGLLLGITESAIYSAGNCFAYLFWICVALLVRQIVYEKAASPS